MTGYQMSDLSLHSPCLRRNPSQYRPLCWETYSYFLTFGDDPQWLKGTVGFLCVCETAYTGCIVHWLYQLTVIGFGSLAIADLVPLTLPISLIIEVTIAVLVQSLYLRRLWIMSKRNWLLITPIAVLLVFRYGACMTTVAFLFRLKKLSAFRSSLTTQATIDAAAYISAASDALIAGSMIYYLRRSQTGFRTSTDGAIRWIIQYLVNTGAITMAVSIALAVTIFQFVAARNSLVFAGLFSVMSRLYANAFLGS
ncbi:hypothetical protein K474DRAFT_404105 [Panus rudis PR-1116 ss-1]|nr:hypothetical protein K474DRAFT_404105 [Panus rudis PR-1116 ss-1]